MDPVHNFVEQLKKQLRGYTVTSSKPGVSYGTDARGIHHSVKLVNGRIQHEIIDSKKHQNIGTAGNIHNVRHYEPDTQMIHPADTFPTEHYTISGYKILENGKEVATFHKIQGQYEANFSDLSAKHRWSDFCNSLSTSETIEAMKGWHPAADSSSNAFRSRRAKSWKTVSK